MIDVFYDGTVIGSFFADVIVKGRVILELKAVEAIAKAHEVQLVNYLKATDTPTGLVINFGPQDITFKRKYRDYTNTKTGRQDHQDPQEKAFG